MPKNRESKALGNLNDFVTMPEPVFDAETEIEALKKRVLTLESLLNDVMQQLDKPFKDQSSKGKKKPDLKIPKPAENSVGSPTPKGTTAPTITEEDREKDILTISTILEKEETGKIYPARHFQKYLRERTGISANRCKMVVRKLKSDGKITTLENVEIDGEMHQHAYVFSFQS